MKKSIFIAIFLGLVVFPSVPVAQAQSFTAEQQASLDTLRETLIDLLIKQIAMLQAQIAELVEKQNQTATTIESLQEQEVVLGASEPVVQTSVTLGTPACSARHPNPSYQLPDNAGYPIENSVVEVPLSISGSWNQIELTYDRYSTTPQQSGTSYVVPANPKQTEVIAITRPSNDRWQPRFNIQNYPDTYEVSIKMDGRNLGTQSVVVPACQ